MNIKLRFPLAALFLIALPFALLRMSGEVPAEVGESDVEEIVNGRALDRNAGKENNLEFPESIRWTEETQGDLERTEVPDSAVTEKRSLEFAILESVEGVFDTEGLLDLGLRLSNGPIDPDVSLVQNSDGFLTYFFESETDGLEGFFWVHPNDHVDGRQAYSVKLEIKAPVEPWIVSGADRPTMGLEMTLIKDSLGRPFKFMMMTTLDINPVTSLENGIDVNAGTIPWGTQYVYDYRSPESWTCHSFGWIDGESDSEDWYSPDRLLGSTKIHTNSLKLLNERIENILKKIHFKNG